jgi:hypothetical protein
MATLVYVDIPSKSNPTACVMVSTSGEPWYLVWDELSNYDKELVTTLETAYQYPLTLQNLIDAVLPNGMSFYQTYKFLFKEATNHTTTFTGSDNPAIVSVGVYRERTQISLQPAVGVTGTLAVTAIPFGKTDTEILLDDAGDPLVIDLAAPQTVIVEGVYTSFYFTPTAVTGAYDVIVLGLH